jgi:hypothetical protein
MSIIRRGLYRVNVVPGDTTELIVRKGRVMLEGPHTKVKGGNKVVFSASSFSVAKLEKAEKKDADAIDSWSKDRAQTLARENSRISERTLSDFANSFNSNRSYLGLLARSGFWLYSSGARCYTFIPMYGGWDSPYGNGYSRSFFPSGLGYFGWRGRQVGPAFGNGRPSGGMSTGGVSGPSRQPGVSSGPRTSKSDRLPGAP